MHTARPGVLIGKKGADIEKLRGELARSRASEVHLNIVEIRKPEIDATLVAETIAQQLERRVAFRRAMKRSVQSAMRLGALGIRINVAGRLGGAEIARTEWYREGRVPLHTLRADIDFGYGLARRPTASSASRCGSSRARSWSTTRWPPRSAPTSCRRAAAAGVRVVTTASAVIVGDRGDRGGRSRRRAARRRRRAGLRQRKR